MICRTPLIAKTKGYHEKRLVAFEGRARTHSLCFSLLPVYNGVDIAICVHPLPVNETDESLRGVTASHCTGAVKVFHRARQHCFPHQSWGLKSCRDAVLQLQHRPARSRRKRALCLVQRSLMHLVFLYAVVGASCEEDKSLLALVPASQGQQVKSLTVCGLGYPAGRTRDLRLHLLCISLLVLLRLSKVFLQVIKR